MSDARAVPTVTTSRIPARAAEDEARAVHRRGEQPVEEALLDVRREGGPRGEPREQRALDDGAGDDEAEVALDVREALQALRRARAGRDDREQDDRQHE